jgi:hypothetical protein
MNLSHQGVIACILWNEIKNHAKNVELGEFVVMPDHVHGILILNGDDTGKDVACNVPTIDDSTIDDPTNENPTDKGPTDKPKNEIMSSISPKTNTI